MQAGDETLGTVFGHRARHEIPIFQRPYVWDEQRHWVPLWNDLRSAAERAEAPVVGGARPRELFLGAFVTQHVDPAPKRVPHRVVIDGQQRMTTLQVCLAAAHRVSAELGAVGAAASFETLVRNSDARVEQFPGDVY
ncbi:MAG: DUF262 domain-containing protein, partial [Cellulomonadaceae bacterium]|nr:DUF262 domain-containing protein [Cellulomonadaceae bacterium]